MAAIELVKENISKTQLKVRYIETLVLNGYDLMTFLRISKQGADIIEKWVLDCYDISEIVKPVICPTFEKMLELVNTEGQSKGEIEYTCEKPAEVKSVGIKPQSEKKDDGSSLTWKLYESPMKERNEEKYGHMVENQCICCFKPMKKGEVLWVHMNEDWMVMDNAKVTEENCEALTGAKTQGCFPIGNDCAKKIPKRFSFLEDIGTGGL